MNEEHRNALKRSLHNICQDLDAEDVLPYLISNDIIQEGRAEEIMKISRKSTRNIELVKAIKEAGPLAFDEFINALRFYKKEFLADQIMGHLSSIPIQQSSSIESMTRLQNALKEMYLQRFKKVNPFSLPFTFDIENTWVSLALRGDSSMATEDHAELLNNAFEKEKMLIIEGKPASGKTSLMRRLAYEWAKGEEKLSHYDLVVYAEFREVREKEFETIADLVIEYHKKYNKFVNSAVLASLKSMLNDLVQNVLILLDGYDESSRDKQCKEMTINYFESSTIRSPLLFNIVLSTRPGFLGQFRGKKGRYTFADVLGFTTEKQKEKYIFNHFKSLNISSKENNAAVHQLLQRNDNINRLAETPLFLTFICLVHERIHDGTVLELYCNTIWWLIDRHQKDFPDRDIPLLFEFQDSSGKDKFEIIQDHYHQFPQLHCLEKMGLQNLTKDIFHECDCQKFDLQEILQQVGLLRKDKFHDQRFRLKTTYSFPHRTIQEFLAALYFFCSEEEFNFSLYDAAIPYSELDTSKMTQYQSFLLQVALSDELPIISSKRQQYFERIADIKVHLTFHAFNTSDGLNNKSLNSLFSQCKNVQRVEVHNNHENIVNNNISNYIRRFFTEKDSNTSSNISALLLLTLNKLLHLNSTTFVNCNLEASTKLSFNCCPILKNMIFQNCELQDCKIDLVSLSAIDSLRFNDCTFEANSQLSVTNPSALKNMKFYKCTFQSSVFNFTELSTSHSLEFDGCTFKANSRLSFKSCPALKILKLWECTIICDTSLGITQSKTIDTLEFHHCIMDLKAWPSIAEEIRNSSVKCLKFTSDCSNYLEFVQQCDNIEEVHIANDWRARIISYNVHIGNDWRAQIKDYEHHMVPNLKELAQNMQSLKRIVFDFREFSGNLKRTNKELIEKAGQERDPNFSVLIIQSSWFTTLMDNRDIIPFIICITVVFLALLGSAIWNRL